MSDAIFLTNSDKITLNSVIQTDVAYGVYLLNKLHRKNILLKKCKDGFNEIKKEAQNFANKVEKDFVKFSPYKASGKDVSVF